MNKSDPHNPQAGLQLDPPLDLSSDTSRKQEPRQQEKEKKKEEGKEKEKEKEIKHAHEHRHEHVHKHNYKKQLLQHPDIWRAGQLHARGTQAATGISSGFADLNEQLPDRGWPDAGLVEFLLTSAGVGELRLLAPALQTLSQTQQRWIAWINPPFIPYAPALEAIGIDISKILLIHPQSHKDTLWSVERACKSGSCSCVMAWPDEKKLKLKDTQRLQVAAKQGRTLSCLFRPQAASHQASMAELRLCLKPGAQTGYVQLDILKRRGGWPLNNLNLAIAAATRTTHRCHDEITEQLSLWRAGQTRRVPSAAQPVLSDNPSTNVLPFALGELRKSRKPKGPDTIQPPIH